jgi:hypothetical protein
MILRCAVCNQTITYLNLLYWQTTPEGDVPFCSPEHATIYHCESQGNAIPPHLSKAPPKPTVCEPLGWWDGAQFHPNPKRDRATDHE